MTPTKEIRDIAVQVGDVGGWHIAGLKLLDAADELDRHRAEEPSTLQTERDVYCLLLSRLVRRMDEIHESDAFKSVWMTHQLHVGPYAGPTYTAELDVARAYLTSAQTQGEK